MLNKVGSIHCGSCGTMLLSQPGGVEPVGVKAAPVPPSEAKRIDVSLPQQPVQRPMSANRSTFPGIAAAEPEPPQTASPPGVEVTVHDGENKPGATLTFSHTMFGVGGDPAGDTAAEPTLLEEPEVDAAAQTMMGLPALQTGDRIPARVAAASDDDMAPTLLMTPEQLSVAQAHAEALKAAKVSPGAEAEAPTTSQPSKTLFGMKAAELGLGMFQEQQEAALPLDDEPDSDTAEFTAVPHLAQTEQPIGPPPGGDEPDPFGLEDALGMSGPAPALADEPGVVIQTAAPVNMGPGFGDTEVLQRPVLSPKDAAQSAGYALAGSQLAGFDDPAQKAAVAASAAAVVVGAATEAAASPAPSRPAEEVSGPAPIAQPPIAVKAGDPMVARALQALGGLALLASTALPFDHSIWSGGSATLIGAVSAAAIGLAAVLFTLAPRAGGLARFVLGALAIGAGGVIAAKAKGGPFDAGGQAMVAYIAFLAGVVLVFFGGLAGFKSNTPDAH